MEVSWRGGGAREIIQEQLAGEVLVKNSNLSSRWCMISQAPVLWLMTSLFTKVSLMIQIIRSSGNCSPIQIHTVVGPQRGRLQDFLKIVCSFICFKSEV